MSERTVKASAEHEAFYKEAMEAVHRVSLKYPNVRTLEVIAMLSRAAGYAIAACFPDERDLARKTAIANLDNGTRDGSAGQPLFPERQGVRE